MFEVEGPDKQLGVDEPVPRLPVPVAGHDGRCGQVSEGVGLVKGPGHVAAVEQLLWCFGQPLAKPRLSLFSPGGVGHGWLRIVQASKDRSSLTMNGLGIVSVEVASESPWEQGHHEDALTLRNTDQLWGTVGDRRHPAAVRIQLALELAGIDIALCHNGVTVERSKYEDSAEVQVP